MYYNDLRILYNKINAVCQHETLFFGVCVVHQLRCLLPVVMLLLLLLLVVIVHHELLRSLNDLKDGEGALRVGLPAVAHVLSKVPRAQVLVKPLCRAQSRVQSAMRKN